MFKENPAVRFGDSVLSGGGSRGGPTANPGAGGWPTIRYYNKKTGVDGANYEKKTDMAMCDELGPKGDTYMQQYIEEAGETSLCSVVEPYGGCNEKSIKFIKKMADAGAIKIAAEQIRLEGMAGKKMKDEQMAWLKARLAILKQLSQPAADSAKDEL
jgi:hypothetical protein